MSVPSVREDYVFLNLPYDTAFEPLYLAYIVGITAFRLFPHTTLEIPDTTRRLDRIQPFCTSAATPFTIYPEFKSPAPHRAHLVSTCLLNLGSQ